LASTDIAFFLRSREGVLSREAAFNIFAFFVGALLPIVLVIAVFAVFFVQ